MSTVAQTISAAKKPQKKASAAAELRQLIPYLGPYKGGILFGLLMLAVMGLIGALPPLIIGSIIDCLKGSPQPMPNLTQASHAGAITLWHSTLKPILYFYQPENRHTLLVLCLMLVGVVVVKGIFSFTSRWVLIGVSRDIEYDLRNDLLARLVKLEPEFYVRNRTGDLMSRCTNDLSAVRMVLGPGIMYSATTLVGMAVALAVMATISPLLTLEVLLPVPFVFITVRYFGTKIHELQARIQAMLATLSAKAQENLSGIRVVRAYGQEEAETRSFDDANRQYVGQNIRMIRAWSLFFPALSTIIGFSIVFVLWQGSRMVVQGRISLGALIAFYTFVGQLVFPMIALGFVTNIFQRGAASMGRLNYVLDVEPGISDAGVHREAPAEVRGDIEFRNLTFTYPTARSGNGTQPAAAGKNSEAAANEPVLRNINLHIPAGATVAIVGPTGSGKTTLAGLIARLWEAPTGTLFIDGQSIREWPLAALRRAIGFVPQDAFLFSDTLRENIAFGVEAATLEAVEDASHVANIAGDISDFPGRYETIVGERGITLSGGQKQRTTLARALIRDPRILILDDAFSSVDTDTEEKILQGLEDVFKERTTILISHRCSTVRDADQIVVLRVGEIIEKGTHEELIGLGGYYAELYQKQLLEEELARE
ncbi:MAG TPA: ABC transporter ATP-binding protein [Candidatus Acidoferrales bacterium]|nr:ABC transporter ATP-binding protein [Candidatus Acidoferrales bacterium]